MRLAKGFAALGLLCCVVLGAAGGQGPADGLEVREDRPRILLTPERLKYLKAKFEREPFEVRDDSANARALRYVLTGDKEDAAVAIESLLLWDVPKD